MNLNEIMRFDVGDLDEKVQPVIEWIHQQQSIDGIDQNDPNWTDWLHWKVNQIQNAILRNLK